MTNVVAFAVVHESEEVLPAGMEGGEAESVQVGAPGGGGGGGVTLICTEQWATPPGPMAVPEYVVVATGATIIEPPTTGITGPML